MGEAFRADHATAHPLEPVIANGRSRVEALLRISWLKGDATRCLGTPYAGIAIGLELQPNGQFVGIVRASLLRSTDLLIDALKVLDVVANFVGQHVGLGEIPRGAEAG